VQDEYGRGRRRSRLHYFCGVYLWLILSVLIVAFLVSCVAKDAKDQAMSDMSVLSVPGAWHLVFMSVVPLPAAVCLHCASLALHVS
jgi:hypothetical protein